MDKDQRGGMSMQKGIWQQESWETWALFSVLHQLPGKPQWAAWGCHLLNPAPGVTMAYSTSHPFHPSLQLAPLGQLNYMWEDAITVTCIGADTLNAMRTQRNHLPVNVNHRHTTFYLLEPRSQSSGISPPNTLILLRSWIGNIWCSTAPGQRGKVRFVYAVYWWGGGNCDCFVAYTDLHHQYVP